MYLIRMKRIYWFVILTSVLLVVAGVGLFSRKGGNIGEVALPSDRIGTVDRIRIRGEDSFRLDMRKDRNGHWRADASGEEFEPDESRIADFLRVLNMWDVREVVEDSLFRSENTGTDPVSFRIVLRSGVRTVSRWTGFVREGEVYVDGGRKGIWKMRSSWMSSSWKDFFIPSEAWWKNRMLVDLDYYAIASVCVRFDSLSGRSADSYRLTADSTGYVLSVPDSLSGRIGEDTLDADIAESYLASFRQVYFDRCGPDERRRMGAPLCSLEIVTRKGERTDFRVYGKRDEKGDPDMFKVLVVEDGDTVALPYVVLDKMVKGAAWFGR